jgi:TatD DNase family protein
LIDGHAHLNEIADTAGAIARARAAGVNQILAVGMDLASNRRTLALAEAHAGAVLPAIGCHPWNIDKDELAATLAHMDEHLDRCIAVGEIGLDYKIKVKKALQWRVFDEMLRLACRHRKPVIVHCRFSHQRCHRMVSEAGVDGAVFHWFSGTLAILDRIIADGYYVSCTPALATSAVHRKAMQHAPLERILVETDCPVPFQGKPSEPALLVETIRQLSLLKGLTEAEVKRVTTATAKKLFRI